MSNRTIISNFLTRIDEQPSSTYVVHERLEHKLPFHRHEKGQMTYIEGGIAYLNTQDKAYFIPGRHYIWIPAGLDHFVQHKNPALIVRNIYFCHDPDSSEPFYNKLGIYPANNLLLEMLQFTEPWKGNIAPGSKQYQFLSTLKDILPQISKHPLPIVLPTSDDERMQPIIEYLHTHLSDPLTLLGVADKFGMSVRTLSRLFQSAMDISFLQYLKLCRAIRAMELLLQTNKTISEIAYETGYTSISAFSNTFYQLVHVRPSDFKKL
jgi:AraC-like DNA-binding protein